MTKTTAEIFADYLGLAPQNAGWAWTLKDWCKTCDAFLSHGFVCKSCNSAIFVYKKHAFTATSPLAVKPTPGWLEVLVNYPSFYAIDRCDYNAFCASIGDDDNPDCPTKAEATHPTRAVALALLAADPNLRARCEQASDASEVLP